MAYMTHGQQREAEAAFETLHKAADDFCVARILTNMASFTSATAHVADAERFAERSLSVLERSCSPDDARLLKPLQILAAARFEEGQTARAIEAFRRINSIRIELPQDYAEAQTMGAVLLYSQGRLKEAEEGFLGALDVLRKSRQSDSANSGAILNYLAALYIGEHRYNDGRLALDRAEAIFAKAVDTVPADKAKLLNLRGVLNARIGAWKKAELDLREALSIADGEALSDPGLVSSVLGNYAAVLRRNHDKREAQKIEVRAAALTPLSSVIDASELVAKSNAH